MVQFADVPGLRDPQGNKPSCFYVELGMHSQPHVCGRLMGLKHLCTGRLKMDCACTAKRQHVVACEGIYLFKPCHAHNVHCILNWPTFIMGELAMCAGVLASDATSLM